MVFDNQTLGPAASALLVGGSAQAAPPTSGGQSLQRTSCLLDNQRRTGMALQKATA